MTGKTKKLFALITIFALIFTFAACGDKPVDAPTGETTTQAEPESTVEPTVDGFSVAETTIIDGAITAAPTEPTEPTEATTVDPAALLTDPATTVPVSTTADEKGGLNSTDATAVVDFYKAAAKKTGKIAANQTMTLKSLNGGDGGVGKLINLFEPIAKKALEKNSTPVDGIPGNHQGLVAADVTSAKATASADGKFTTVNIKLKSQTDPAKADSGAGPVGHGISTLGDIDKAINELNGVSVDYSEGTLSLLYNDAYITAKIDNATGKIVGGTWHYAVNVTIDNVVAKITIISATLKGASGVVDYKVVL